MYTKLYSAICWVLVAIAVQAASLFDGWSPKFYHGLEANGKVSALPFGFKGKAQCLELLHVDGAQKFGAEKQVKSSLVGAVEWIVSADVWCGEGGVAGVSMEFFNAKGETVGLKDGEEIRPRTWIRREWRFAAPVSATVASVHVLSLATGPVRFANVDVKSVKGSAADEIPFKAKALPMQWNFDWNGGKSEFTSFVESPMPMSFHFMGERARLKKPAFEIDIPADLELLDSFTAHQASYRAERPIKETSIVRDGIAYVRLRFEGVNVFNILLPVYGWERKLELLIGLKKGAERKEHTVYWRLADGERNGPEAQFLMRFVNMPTNLRRPKNFTILSWQCDDLVFSSDEALEAAIPAYEAAGLTWFQRMNGNFRRGKEVERILSARPAGWKFAFGFADLWNPRFLGQGSKEFKALNVKHAQFANGKQSKHSLCPDYFNKDPDFFEYYKERIVLAGLKRAGVKTGDIVSSDFEPWGSQNYCVCDRCRKSFAKYAGLANVPMVSELKNHSERWAEFRCSQTEETLRRFFQIIREYNPGLVLCDYDYVLLYGTKHEKQFVTGCAKDSRRNEKWFDMHICSYYHICGLKSFEAIRNNTRHLNKKYMPLGAVGGYGGYLRAGEVQHPRQLRMLALASFVHGCPGFGFYQGLHYDGEHLLAFMKARDEIAAVENFAWGLRKGSFSVVSDNAKCVFASVRSEDENKEAVAIFNYDAAKSVTVNLMPPKGELYEAVNPVDGSVIATKVDSSVGVSVSVHPEDVRFVLFARK